MHKRCLLISYLITILSCSFFEDEEDKQVPYYSDVQTPSTYQENTNTPQKTNTEQENNTGTPKKTETKTKEDIAAERAGLALGVGLGLAAIYTAIKMVQGAYKKSSSSSSSSY